MIAAAEATDRRSMVVPVALGAAAVGGVLYLQHRKRARPADEVPVDELPMIAPSAEAPPPPSGRWVFPVPRWQGRDPVVSDGYGSPRLGSNRGGIHRGADIMFRRRSATELIDVFPPSTKEAPSPHTRMHFVPPGTLVLAAGDGEIWSAGWTPRGYSVVLNHGRPWATYYTHLASLRVGETKRGGSKQRVRAGQPLGVIGADPKDARGVAHLHFELWHGGAGLAAIDPVPYLRRWLVVDAPEVH